MKGKGAVLIFVLWMLFILSTIAMEISFSSRVTREASHFLGKKIYYYPLSLSLLDAGVFRFSSEEVKINKSYEFKLGKDTWIVSFQSEGSKIDVNKMDEKTLEKLLGICGVEIGERRSVIVDSFLDWRDADSDRRFNGAEDDYYESLSPPYEARDGRIVTLDELLLIRGFTPELFQCISRFLTVYGGGKGINVNYASKDELVSIGMSQEEAEAIIERREEEPITKDILTEIIPDAEDREWFSLISFKPSSVYKVEIHRKGERAPSFTFIISLGKSSYKILETIW